uniref:J domain-containing protein n=1 Tax=Calcidiscus leptoporus TaxID=127549 RepID=A0A7S0NSC5_9EUKA
MCANAFRVLGVASSASHAEIKVAFRALAKEWHPDLHHGARKVAAEEKFKQIQAAYQRLLNTHDEAARPSGSVRRKSRNPYGGKSQYGEAGKAGYDPFKGYMNFNASKETTDVRTRVENARHQRMLVCAGAFTVGLLAVMMTSRRDQKKREKGELVDAYWNQVTRRWEIAPATMLKDPLLSTMVHLKPPEMVHKATPNIRRTKSKARTLDGRNADDAYRARQQGHRT